MMNSGRLAASASRQTLALFAALGLAVTLPTALTAPAYAQQTQGRQGPDSVADLAAGLLDAVVNISTSQKTGADSGPARPESRPQLPEGSPFQEYFDDFFKDGDKGPAPGQGQKVQSLGSGFVIDAKEGIVITNNHVIADSDEIEVIFKDEKKLKAVLIGTDPKTDIAVLKIDPTKHKLTAVPLGDSDKIRIGDWVMAIGNPFGLGGSVSIGIVSARNRNINSGPYDDFIQTDAAINRGNSGGPLFNMNGEVIGINTAIFSTTGGSIGIGFSIPSQLAKNVIAQLREFGETRRGWLGVRIQPVTDDVAESLGMTGAAGALVSGIIKGGPVDKGELLAGDVIVTFDGRAIKNMQDLPRIVAESPVGKAVDVEIIRKGQRQKVKVTLGRLEDGEEQIASAEGGGAKPGAGDEAPVKTANALGMTLGELDDAARKQFQIAESVAGVVITEVAENSVAAEKGIVAGEVVVEIAQEAVGKPGDILDRIDRLKKDNRKNALLMIAAPDGEIRFETLRLN
jgi:serine protease Do